VPPLDGGTKAAGVMTHEFGHGITLSHTQANGHITFFGSPWYWQLVGFPGAMLAQITNGAQPGLYAADRPIEP
jgi:hypothetical protein